MIARCPVSLVTRARRGTVLFTVLVIGMISILIVAGLLAVMEAEVTARAAVRRESLLRTHAVSAFSLVAEQLDAQRIRILDGASAEPPPARLELFEEDGRVLVVQLLPVGPGGSLMASENARLDLNRATAEALTATGLVDPDLAERIVAERTRRGQFRAVEELLSITGVTPELMEGDEPIPDFAAQAAGEEADLRTRMLERLGGAQPRGLFDVLTVHAAEPPLQRSGVRRIGLNREWTEELGSRLDERFGSGTGRVMQGLMQQQGQRFPDDRTIVSVLRRFSVGIDQWPDILDALTGRVEEEIVGRIDINSAPAAALQGAGFTPEEAEQIVAVRASLSEDEQWTVTWPLSRNVLDAERFEELIERITVRSWIYRMRLAILEVDAGDDMIIHAGPLVFDVIYDLVDPVARIAALREVTHLPLARLLGEILLLEGDDRDELLAQREEDAGDDLGSVGTAGSGVTGPAPFAPLPGFGSGDFMADPAGDLFGNGFGDDANDFTSVSASRSQPSTSRRLGRWRAE